MLKLKGQIVSAVSSGPKGVGLKVMVTDLGDVYRVFIPIEKVSGHQNLKLGDNVDVTINRFYVSKNEIRLDGSVEMLKK